MLSFIEKFKEITHIDSKDTRLSRAAKQAQKSQGATGIVSLRDLKLKALPERLQQSATARVIDAGGNKLTKIPSWIGTFGDTLHRLTLSNNRLMSLPTELNQLRHLKAFVVAHNRLTALPANLNLPRLELLDVSHNNLVKLTAGISKSTNLRELRASNNHLEVIPLQLGSCLALQHADFAKNTLSALPVELSKLQKLQLLNLDDNSILAIPPPIFFGCASLQTLTLHGCPVTIKDLEATQGFADFELRRRQKFNKHIASNTMFPVGGMQESASRA